MSPDLPDSLVVCPNCGGSNRAGARFCSICGHMLGAPSSGGAVPPAAWPSPPPPVGGPPDQPPVLYSPSPPSTPPLSPSADASNARTLALGSHLSGIVIPIIGPVVVLAMNKDGDRFVEHHAKEALNAQISLMGVALLAMVVTLLTLGFAGICAGPVMMVAGIALLIFSIQAAMAANNGQEYRYPGIVRIIK